MFYFNKIIKFTSGNQVHLSPKPQTCYELFGDKIHNTPLV